MSIRKKLMLVCCMVILANCNRYIGPISADIPVRWVSHLRGRYAYPDYYAVRLWVRPNRCNAKIAVRLDQFA